MGKKKVSGKKPQYRGWGLAFYRTLGLENRADALAALLLFIADSSIKYLDMRPFNCLLTGELFGQCGHINGKLNVTKSKIATLERTAIGNPSNYCRFNNDEIKVTLEDGEYFYIYTHRIDLFLMSMMGELHEEGTVSEAYMHPKFKELNSFDYQSYF